MGPGREGAWPRGRVSRALHSGGRLRSGAGEAGSRAPGTRSKAFRGAAGGAETQELLQELRPAPAAAPAAVSAPCTPSIPHALRESPTPRLLQRCARWLRARMPRAAVVATVAAAAVAPAAAAAAAAAPGPGEVRGVRGGDLGSALGVRFGRQAMRSRVSRSHRASPPSSLSPSLARAEAALVGLELVMPGAPCGLIPHLQGVAEMVIDRDLLGFPWD